MKCIIQLLLLGILLLAFHETACAAQLLEVLGKERAESELGLVIKREFLGFGSDTNEAHISIEFAPKGKLEGFMCVTLDVYLEGPFGKDPYSPHYRRLTSVTLRPVVETKEKVRVFFSIDPEYLDRTDISIRVRFEGTGPDGYNIRLKAKDFPSP
ncbi:MAG TPA: hypothetical protein VEC99_01605 [Clostridia bacterium]|nr:hypothetical protein [Clostridia bacterium]